MIEPASIYRRSVQERNDQLLSWNRSNKAFFAAGACHILAFCCKDFLSHLPIKIVLLTANSGSNTHVYASYKERAFDFNGWSSEAELVAVNNSAAPFNYEQVLLKLTLEEFCLEYNHRLPSQFAYNPWPRAEAFIHTLLGQ